MEYIDAHTYTQTLTHVLHTRSPICYRNAMCRYGVMLISQIPSKSTTTTTPTKYMQIFCDYCACGCCCVLFFLAGLNKSGNKIGAAGASASELVCDTGSG